MKKILLVIICIVVSGCAGLTGSESVEVEKRVRTLGVLPLLVDSGSIEYSNRDGLVALLEESGQDVDDWLVEQLRKKGDYFDVRLIEGENSQLFEQIVSNRTVTGEGLTRHSLYSLNPEGVTRLINDNLVDAVLVVIVHGVKRPEKRWSEYGSGLEYMETEYRSLLYTASVVAAQNETLWLRNAPPGSYFLRIDYPDFMEAFWNVTDEVHVKEITLPGLQRRLAEPENGIFVKTAISKKYNTMVEELVRELKKGM